MRDAPLFNFIAEDVKQTVILNGGIVQHSIVSLSIDF